jgi:hypothetical protein
MSAVTLPFAPGVTISYRIGGSSFFVHVAAAGAFEGFATLEEAEAFAQRARGRARLPARREGSPAAPAGSDSPSGAGAPAGIPSGG